MEVLAFHAVNITLALKFRKVLLQAGKNKCKKCVSVTYVLVQ